MQWLKTLNLTLLNRQYIDINIFSLITIVTSTGLSWAAEWI